MTPIRRWWAAMGLILLVATWARVANLGTFSLWRDEIFTMTVADQPLGQVLEACARDAENVPLYAVIAHLGLRLGCDETTLRILPILAGLASIVVFALWVRRHVGASEALATAAFFALSTFHLRYSQELRSYPYLMLLCGLTMLAADRLRRTQNARSVLAVAAVVAVGMYTHLIYPLILIPATGALLLAEDESRQLRRPGCRVWAAWGLGLALGLLAFAPWIWKISHTLVERMPRSWVTDWSWAVVGNRWHVWTVAGWENDRIGWLGLLLAAIAAIGLVRVLRSPVGVAVVAPALLTVVGWELLMLVIHHWSNSRYNLPLWPFVALLIGVGACRLLRWLRRRWIQLAAALVLALMLTAQVRSYHRVGRPHWDRLASIVARERRPGETLLTGDHWAQICLSYYLGERLRTIAGHPDRLDATLAGSDSVLLVHRIDHRWEPPRADLDRTRLAEVPRTGRLDRLTRSVEDPETSLR